MLDEYWEECKTHYKKRMPKLPMPGGTLMVNLAAMSAEFCENTWCALDFPLAVSWEGELER